VETYPLERAEGAFASMMEGPDSARCWYPEESRARRGGLGMMAGSFTRLLSEDRA